MPDLHFSVHAERDSSRTLRTTTRATVFTLALLTSGIASAQNTLDRAYVGFTWTRGTEIGSQGGKLKEQLRLDVRPFIPVVSLGKLKLIPSLGFETRWMGMERRTAPLQTEDVEKTGNVHRFQLGLSLLTPISTRALLLTGITTNIRPDFSKGFKEFDAQRDIAWTGIAMGSYFLGGDPRKTLTLGLAAQYPFEKIPVFPIVGFSYRVDPYILELGAPRTTLLRKVGNNLELGLTAAFERQVFRADLPDTDSTAGVRYVSQTELRVGPVANLRLGSSNVWLSASGGLDFINDYALLDSERERIYPDLPGSTKPAPYLRFLVSWRPQHPTASSRPARAPEPAPTASTRSPSPLLR
ncbi:hypothetical protein LZ198_18145 [Myxococcus sp. K15C18031901]|uniref:hypothetical protein n=1 Tax=Myxococcus dinghuensis TaxID=2906761 RepID=UPI0020A7F713|nr:hypothetical protein [Myxococcus dinghuensis]MCP3100795.1 hypothetical protein [Myxococcus dinghuensis]